MQDLGPNSSIEEDHTVEQINHLLSRLECGSLQNLVLRVHRTPERPAPKAINKHKRTLRTLVVDITRPFHIPELWSVDSLYEMLEGCDNLLEAAFTTMDFGVEECEDDRHNRPECTSLNYIRTILECAPRLETLNMLDWPAYRGHPHWDLRDELRDTLKPERLSAGIPVLNHIAAYLFEVDYNEHNGNLQVVAFGTREKGKPMPKYFVPLEGNVFNGKVYTATEATLAQLEREGMHTKSLEYNWLQWTARNEAWAFEWPNYLQDEYELQELEERFDRTRKFEAERVIREANEAELVGEVSEEITGNVDDAPADENQ